MFARESSLKLPEKLRMDDSSMERRRSYRTLVEQILKSALIKPADDNIEIWGMIVDQSVQGVQVSVPIALSPETAVEFIRTQQDENGQWEDNRHAGRVCWCKADGMTGESYRVGIEFSM